MKKAVVSGINTNTEPFLITIRKMALVHHVSQHVSPLNAKLSSATFVDFVCQHIGVLKSLNHVLGDYDARRV